MPFERAFGLHNARNCASETYRELSWPCRSLRHSLGDLLKGRPTELDRDTGAQDVKLLRALTLGVALIFPSSPSQPETPAHAGASILVEADLGKVLRAENATYPWYPASTFTSS